LIRGIIFDVRRYAIHDGPGIRTTVFLKGCPLACWWCHNPESQAPGPELIFRESRCIACGACIEACPNGIPARGGMAAEAGPADCKRCGACAAVCYAGAREIVGREATVEEVMFEVERDRTFYERSGGGVTFSGGEPLMQPEFLEALLAASRERGIRTAIDTCGYAPWVTIDGIRGLVDLFLYDLKVVDEARHVELTGVSNEIILANLRRLSEAGHAIILRVAIIPGINDNDDSLRAIGAFASHLPKLIRLDILPYNRMGVEKYARLDREYRLGGAPPLSDERLKAIGKTLEGFGLRVSIGG
jgi:pyruvate formate lyase activating enzyme